MRVFFDDKNPDYFTAAGGLQNETDMISLVLMGSRLKTLSLDAPLR